MDGSSGVKTRSGPSGPGNINVGRERSILRKADRVVGCMHAGQGRAGRGRTDQKVVQERRGEGHHIASTTLILYTLVGRPSRWMGNQTHSTHTTPNASSRLLPSVQVITR